jgi:hypothetical protein
MRGDVGLNAPILPLSTSPSVAAARLIWTRPEADSSTIKHRAILGLAAFGEVMPPSSMAPLAVTLKTGFANNFALWGPILAMLGAARVMGHTWEYLLTIALDDPVHANTNTN